MGPYVPAVEVQIPVTTGLQTMTTGSSGPWAHSIHARLETSLIFLSLALKICSQQEALCSCSKRSPSSLGSLCPSVRDGECVVVIRGDCWEAGCHGTTEARASLPGCHHFPGWIHNHRNERRTHGKGERSGSPLTIISCQSRVRGSRLSRGGAHLDMDQAFTERGLVWAGCGFVVLHGSGALPGFQHCFYRKPLFLTH